MEDLFKHPDKMPSQVKGIIDKYDNGDNEMDYEDLGNMQKELESIGYTFDYYLDGTPFLLQKLE